MINYRIIAVINLCVFNLFCNLALSEELSFDKAFNIVQGCERQIGTLHWRASVDYKVYGPDLNVSLQDKYTIEAFFDPVHKFYNITYKKFPPTEIKSPLVVTNQMAFDGNNYTYLDQTCGNGGISHNKSDFPSSYRFSGLLYSQEGALPGLPNIFSLKATTHNDDSRTDLLSSFFRSWKDSKNTKYIIDDDGVLNITVDTKLLCTTDCPASIALSYDTKKGGIISNIVVRYKQLDENKIVQEKELCSWKVDTELNGNGKWVPTKTIYSEFAAGRLFATLEAIFESVDINTSIKDDQFVISMPDGVYVDDFIKKIRYKVGTPIDEDKAIDAFMRSNDLTGDVPAQIRQGSMLRYFLMGVGLLVMGIAVYQKMQKRRKV